MKAGAETGQVRTKDVRGNFDMGTWFGDVKCIHGHSVRLFVSAR